MHESDRDPSIWSAGRVSKYEEVPDPAPRDGEIRIRIHAATVNRVLDVSVRAGNEGGARRRCCR